MSDNNDPKSFDPFQVWRRMRDASMDAWANAMTLTANTEAYARTTGAMLDASLTASIPLRQFIENAMGQALQQYNMPSRADFISLAHSDRDRDRRSGCQTRLAPTTAPS